MALTDEYKASLNEASSEVGQMTNMLNRGDTAAALKYATSIGFTPEEVLEWTARFFPERVGSMGNRLNEFKADPNYDPKTLQPIQFSADGKPVTTPTPVTPPPPTTGGLTQFSLNPAPGATPATGPLVGPVQNPTTPTTPPTTGGLTQFKVDQGAVDKFATIPADKRAQLDSFIRTGKLNDAVGMLYSLGFTRDDIASYAGSGGFGGSPETTKEHYYDWLTKNTELPPPPAPPKDPNAFSLVGAMEKQLAGNQGKSAYAQLPAGQSFFNTVKQNIGGDPNNLSENQVARFDNLIKSGGWNNAANYARGLGFEDAQIAKLMASNPDKYGSADYLNTAKENIQPSVQGWLQQNPQSQLPASGVFGAAPGTVNTGPTVMQPGQPLFTPQPTTGGSNQGQKMIWEPSVQKMVPYPMARGGLAQMRVRR